MTLPVTFTFNLGFMVALGILLDTFVVRTIMLPAAIELIGDKVWWPSTASGGDTDLPRPRRGGAALRRGARDHGLTAAQPPKKLTCHHSSGAEILPQP